MRNLDENQRGLLYFGLFMLGVLIGVAYTLWKLAEQNMLSNPAVGVSLFLTLVIMFFTGLLFALLFYSLRDKE